MFNANDVSEHQVLSTKPMSKKSGINHAMIRAGYARFALQIDSQFKTA